jgi:arsenate reductase-like glutaredoxin family protein
MTTLYGLSNCDTCKKARNWLQRFGVAHDVRRLSRQPPAGRDARRLGEAGRRLGHADQQVVDDVAPVAAHAQDAGQRCGWQLLLKEHPQLIRRPVVVMDDGTMTQGFSDNGFKKLFGVVK